MTKIIYNDDNKKGVINSLNTCINNLGNINNILSNTYIPYGFYYTNTLRNLKNNLVNTKEDLVDYKNDINKYMENINKNELELSSRINKIEDVIVEKFD